MAMVRFIEHNGQRIEITAAPVVIEIRCDGCGEFIGSGKVESQSTLVTVRGRGEVEVATDAHPEHLRDAVIKQISICLLNLIP
jgi:hypothetical protein